MQFIQLIEKLVAVPYGYSGFISIKIVSTFLLQK